MGTIYKEVNDVVLKEVPLITLTKTQIKVSGTKFHYQQNKKVNKRVRVSIYSYYKEAVIAVTDTNDFGYFQIIFEKKDLSIGKYEVRYDGTGYRSALKPLGDWDIFEVTKEMLISGINTFLNIIGAFNLKAYSNDGEKTGTIDGEHIYTNTIQLVWDDFRTMKPSQFPMEVTDAEGNVFEISYEQALSIETYVVFMFVSDNEISSPPNDYPVDTQSPSRWFIVNKTKLSEANVFLPNEKYFAFWVGGYINENIFTQDQQNDSLPGSSYQRLIY